MRVSTLDFVRARDVAARLLDELDLDAWLFEIEPKENHWELKVECATDSGWETVTVGVHQEVLQQCCDDEQKRRALVQEWGGRLRACKRAEVQH